MLNVVCIKTGDKFDDRYVPRLKSMVDRNLTIPHNFVCFTDDIIDGIDCREVKSNYGGWWDKTSLFREDLGIKDRMLYFDLDMLIVDNIDDIAKFDAPFTIIKQWKNLKSRGRGGITYSNYNSSCMVWKTVGNRSIVWTELTDDKKEYWRSDQDWVGRIIPEEATFPSEWFRGFEQCKAGPPKNCKVVICNVHDNHTIDHIPWVNEIWR